MFLSRIVLRNYRSIGACDVHLAPLTFIAGRTGSGKSNFLDALRFVADSLRHSLEHALRVRGGIGEVRRRSSGHPTHFGIRLDFRLDEATAGHYAFRIGARASGGWEVQREECAVEKPAAPPAVFVAAESPADRLYLAGAPDFRAVHDALSRMRFYNLNPDRMRDLQIPDPGEMLARDGGNLASVIAHVASTDPPSKARLERRLGSVVAGIPGLDPIAIGPRRFLPAGMSDGTLRALGTLVAIFQPVPLVGIDEPLAALNAGAARVLLETLREASRERQLLATTSAVVPGTDALVAIQAADGTTEIAAIEETALREHLDSEGDGAAPVRTVLDGPADPQLALFDEAGPPV